MSFKNPTPVVVGLYRVDHSSFDDTTMLLAIRRAIEPMIGGFAFPGGYIDEGETAEIAMSREMLEETGIATLPQHWRPMLTRITESNRLLIFMRHIFIARHLPTIDAMAGSIPNREVSGFRFVDERDSLCFPLHQEILQRKAFWE